MASADLFNLINLSLGVEPNGVVNFNYLHTLLHEIVARLTDHESVLEASGGYDILEKSLEEGHPFIVPDYQVEDPSTAVSTADKMEEGRAKDDKQIGRRKDGGGSAQKRATSGKKKDSQKGGGGGEARDGKKSPDLEKAGSRKSSAGSVKGAEQQHEQKELEDRGTSAEQQRGKDVAVDQSAKDITGDLSTKSVTKDQMKDVTEEQQKSDGVTVKIRKGGEAIGDSGRGISLDEHRGRASRFQTRAGGARSQRTTPPKGADSKDAEGPTFTGRRKKAAIYPLRSRVSSSTGGEHVYSKSFHGLSMAANDVSALEKQLVDIEVRLGAVEALPELLSMKASDSTSTPLSDMWSFSNMDHRLHAAEKNMAKVSDSFTSY